MDHGPIGHESLQIAYGHRLSFHATDAYCFALGLLGTDPAADRWKGIVVLKYRRGAEEVPFGKCVDKLGYGNHYRTAFHALAALALQAAPSLPDRALQRESPVYLFEGMATLFPVTFRHMDTVDCEAFLG